MTNCLINISPYFGRTKPGQTSQLLSYTTFVYLGLKVSDCQNIHLRFAKSAISSKIVLIFGPGTETVRQNCIISRFLTELGYHISTVAIAP